MIWRSKTFYIWFSVGAVLPLLHVFLQSVEINLAGITAVLNILVAPGLVPVLPLMNLIPHPVWPITLIVLANGIVYGLIAIGITRLVQKK